MFVTKHEYISEDISLRLENRNRILWYWGLVQKIFSNKRRNILVVQITE